MLMFASLLSALVVMSGISLGGLQPATPPPPADPKDSKPEQSIYDSLQLKPRSTPAATTPTQAPPQAATLRAPRTRVAAVGKRYALLVGVEQAVVNGVTQHALPACPADSIAMAAALKQAGYECIVVNDAKETGSEKYANPSNLPTVGGVRAAVARVCGNAGPSDQVLIYFSTHGVILPGPTGGVTDGPAILAMRDGALKIDDVKSALAKSQALTRILLLDCCRDNKHFAPKASEFRDVHVITACRPEETSMTGPRGLSVFTEAFIAGMTDCRADRYVDGQVELDELLNYVVDEVPRLAHEIDAASSQNPTRTVVDPRTVNPIVVSCASTSIYDGLLPTAMQGPVQALPRDDLVLSGSIAGKIAIGMTEKEMAGAMGRAPDEPAGCDAKGDGLAMYSNTPRQSDTVFVFFAKHKVSRVMVMYAKLCDGDFDAAKSRAALKKLLDGRDLTRIGEVINHPTTKDLFAKLGCPTGGLMYGQNNETGSVHYDDVPLPGQRLSFRFTDGVVTDVMLDPKPKWAE